MRNIQKIKKDIEYAVTSFRAQLAFGGEIVLSKMELLELIARVENQHKAIVKQGKLINSLQKEIEDMEMEMIVQIEQEEIYRG